MTDDRLCVELVCCDDGQDDWMDWINCVRSEIWEGQMKGLLCQHIILNVCILKTVPRYLHVQPFGVLQYTTQALPYGTPQGLVSQSACSFCIFTELSRHRGGLMMIVTINDSCLFYAKKQNSWKEILNSFSRDVNMCQQWEQRNTRKALGNQTEM